MGEPSFQALLEALKSDDAESQIAAARELGNAGDPRATPFLLQALNGADVYAAWNIERALERIAEAQSRPEFALEEEEAGVTDAINRALALAEQGDPYVAPLAILADPSLTPSQKFAILSAMSEARIGRKRRYPIGNVHQFLAYVAADSWVEAKAREGATVALEASNLLRASSSPEEDALLLRPAQDCPNPSDAKELLRAIDKAT